MKRAALICFVFLLVLGALPPNPPMASAAPQPPAPAAPPPAAPQAAMFTDPDGVSGFEVLTLDDPKTLNPTKSLLWWSTRGLTSCGEFPNQSWIKLRPQIDTAKARVLVKNECHTLQSPSANVVRDTPYIYYFTSGQLMRKSTVAVYFMPAEPLTMAPALSGGVSSTPLAIDAQGWLYWSDFAGGVLRIYRMPADNSAPATVFAQINSSSATVSGLMTYRQAVKIGAITRVNDGVVFNNNGALWRFHQNGGAAQLGSGVGPFWVHRSSTALGPTATVYAVQGAALKSFTLGGAASTLYQVQAGSSQISAVTTDATNAYLVQSSIECSGIGVCTPTDGALYRRALSAAAGAPWSLVAPNGVGSAVRSDGQRIFYAGFDGKSIHTLPTNTPGVSIDIKATGVEITQGLQNMDHSFPLVAGHPTVVRGYAQISATPAALKTFRVTARLEVTRNSVQKLGVLEPTNPVTLFTTDITSGTLDSQRVTATLSFNYVLPEEWTLMPPGMLFFEHTVNPFGDPPENVGANPYANNKASRPLPVEVGPRPCLMLIPVRTKAPVPAHVPEGTPSILARARSLLPVRDFRVFTNYTSTELEDNWILSDDGDPYELEPGDDDWAIWDLWWLDAWSDEWAACNDLHWVGMVHPSTDWGWTAGANYQGWNALLAKWDTGGGATRWMSPKGGTTLAHELSHAYDRGHIKCGDFPAGQDVFDPVPYNPCHLYFTNSPLSSNYVGFDPISMRAIRPDGAADLLSYAKRRWISQHHWNALRGLIPDPVSGGLRAASPAASGAALYVSGQIDAHTQSASFRSIYQTAEGVAPAAKVAESLSKAQAWPASGTAGGHARAPFDDQATYSVRLVDAAGATLSTTAVITSPTSTHEGHVHTLGFSQFVPWNPQAKRIQLLSDSIVVAQTTISANAPTVDLHPLEADAAAQTVRLSWTAADRDQQELHAMIQYSADDGATWRALTKNITGLEATVSTKGLPGSSQARFRVIIDDGVRTAVDTSEAITVARHAPEVVIDGVVENERRPQTSDWRFDGMALDADEGSLGGDRLLWTLSGPQTMVISGSQVTLNKLAPGQYTLTATATDSDGMTGAAVRHFEVLPILVPTAGAAPALDGFCSDSAYENGVDLPLGNGGEAALVRADSSLYVCLRGLSASAGPQPNLAGIQVDANNSRDATAQAGDRGFFINEHSELFQTVGNGSIMTPTLAPAAGFNGYAEKGPAGWNAELRIDESLVGGWNHLAGLMFQTNVAQPTSNSGNYPKTALFNKPNTWAAASFGAAIATPNRAPAAHAGTDQTVAPSAPARIYLDGTASADADLDPLTYAWTQVAGPSVSLTSAITATPSFELAPVAAPTTLTFHLVVKDGSADSVADTVTITALPPKRQMAPIRTYMPFINR